MKTETEHITASSVCVCTTEDFVIPGTVIQTDIFKSSASDYIGWAITGVIRRRWWVIIIPLIIISASALIFDTRWLFVDLIFLFLIAPFLIANAYFSRLLTPNARLAISEKRIKIISGIGIEITYIGSEGEIQPTRTIQWSHVKQVKQHGRGWMIELDDSPPGGIIIPNAAIVDKYRQQNNDNSPHSSDFFDKFAL